MLLWIDWQDLATQIFWWDFYRRSCRTNGVKPGTRKFLAPNMAEWLSGSGLTATYHPNNDFHGQFQLQVDRCFETGLYFIYVIYIYNIYIYIYNIYIYVCVIQLQVDRCFETGLYFARHNVSQSGLPSGWSIPREGSVNHRHFQIMFPDVSAVDSVCFALETQRIQSPFHQICLRLPTRRSEL